jgi:cytochrome oxidase Cu insertion factor (SCO1/SenC/PrrC family)
MRRRITAGLALAALLTVGLSLSAVLAKPPAGKHKGAAKPPKDVTVQIVDGPKFQKLVDSLKGKVVVINFYMTT